MALQRDEISIDIAGVSMKVSRFSTLSDAFEVTTVIPRVELRIWRYQDGKLVEVEEKILNSITIAHSPRHPPAGENTAVKSPSKWRISFGPKL